MMARLQQEFDHWFEWRPVTPDAAFQDRVRQLPILTLLIFRPYAA